MKRIIYNYLYNLLYQIVALVIPFITIPYVSRVLGPENLGVESYTVSVVSLFIVFETAGSSIFATRSVAKFRDTESNLNKIIYNILLLRIILGCLTTAVYFIFLFNSDYKYYFLIQLFYLLANSIFDCTWYFSGKERFKEITFRNITIKIIGFISTLLLVKNTDDLYIYILINGLTIFIPNIYFFIVLLKEVGKPKKIYFSKDNFNLLLLSLLPFFFMEIVIQIYMNIDKIILEHYNLTYELGIYSQIIKTFNTFLAPITSIGTILMPYVSNLSHKDDNIKIRNILELSTNTIILIGVPIYFGLIIISSEFVNLYFGEKFIHYEKLFKYGSFLILTGSLSNIIIQQVILPNLKERIYLKGLIIATFVRVSLLIILVKRLGIFSALIAYILGELVILFWCSYKTKEIFNSVSLLFNKNNMKIFVSGLIMYISLCYFNIGLFLKIILGVIIYFIFLFIFKEKITSLVIRLLSNIFNWK